MLMNFSGKKGGERACGSLLRGRTGHRVARLNDSIFVMGGADREGQWVSELHRINSENCRIDSLILDTVLPLEGFSFFSLREALLVWGGRSYTEHSNQLYNFDGSRFMPLRQHGQVPAPRADHLSVIFGGKYLIIFGGHNATTFFNDWHLLNTQTNEWAQLSPSLPLPYCSGGQMIWLGGRGILLLNEVFNQQLQMYHPNKLFQFYVNDFNSHTLKLVPLEAGSLGSVHSPLFSQLAAYDQESFLVFGGHRKQSIQDIHSLCYRVSPDTDQLEKLSLNSPRILGFQSCFYKNTLYFIGGDTTAPHQTYHGLSSYSFPAAHHHFKRHVCEMCRLYYDEQWTSSSSEVYLRSSLKEDYDYNYRMRLDNRVMQRLSGYIRNEFHALTLIISCLKELAVLEIDISLVKVKETALKQLRDDSYQFLRIGCILGENILGLIINQLLMEKQMPVAEGLLMADENLRVDRLVLQLKIATFKLGRSTLMVFRVSAEEVFVIYYSSNQLECTSTNFSPCASYFYRYNLKKKECSSPIIRGLILENLKPLFKHQEEYEEMGDLSCAIIVICGDELESELTLFEQNIELETGESSLIGSLKEDCKRGVPLIQLSFLSSEKLLPQIYIEHNLLVIIDLYELLEGDSRNKVLEPIELGKLSIKSKTLKTVTLFHYPEEYWFKRVLVYHRGRLLSHFKQPERKICGVIELGSEVELDLGGTNLAHQADRKVVEGLFSDIQNFKRIRCN